MSMRALFLACVFSLLLPAVADAGVTLLETRSDDGEIQEIYTDGARMRAQVKGNQQYMILDLKGRKMYMVDPAERRVADMSGMLQTRGRDRAQQAGTGSLVHRGKGPTVAGFATERYAVESGGKSCGEVMLSRKALEALPNAAALLEGLAALADSGPPVGADPCARADDALLGDFRRLGLPLVTIDAKGRKTMEVLRMVRNASPPPGAFSLPEGYEVVDVGREMEGAMKQAEDALREMMPPAGQGGAQADEVRRALEQLRRRMGQ